MSSGGGHRQPDVEIVEIVQSFSSASAQCHVRADAQDNSLSLCKSVSIQYISQASNLENKYVFWIASHKRVSQASLLQTECAFELEEFERVF